VAIRTGHVTVTITERDPMSPETIIKRNLQETYPDENTRSACMALVLTLIMLVVTFTSVAVLVLAGRWIDHVLCDS
jgi:hypothetical protein